MLTCRVQHQLNPQRLNHLYRIARSLNSVERTKLTLVINAGSLVGTTTIAAWVKNATKYLLVHILTLLGPIITFAVQVSKICSMLHNNHFHLLVWLGSVSFNQFRFVIICSADFCEASNTCTQPCPSGFDAQCPEGQRCVHNTPCNANMRLATTRTLEYGLPVSVANLARNYDPGQESQTNAAPGENNVPWYPLPKTAAATIAAKGICSSFVFVSLFTICLNGLVV